jgi:transcriptional regulator with XRE-family HTH domain
MPPRTLTKNATITLGFNLKEMREYRKLTQAAAAKKAGIHRSLLTKWEIGLQSIGLEGVLLMAVTYHCPIDQLLSGVDEHYDDIIEGRLPVDAVRHYRAKVAAFTREGNRAMDTMKDAIVPAPMTEETAEGQERARGKSSRVRVRRKPGK